MFYLKEEYEELKNQWKFTWETAVVLRQMGGMWSSSWGPVVPGRTLCFKQESYHKQTTTSPVISNPATHVHLLIMSIESPKTPCNPHTLTHAHSHAQTLTQTWLQRLGKVQRMHVSPAPERFRGSMNANTHADVHSLHTLTHPPLWTS